ncbi:unnamed protein product [Clonostachys solani]|uniref:Uncharacterized protein n=1 Tax=Clonostachys solani TaxID=160281 RepID=A0A9N9Z9H0_9HYPO|nr:unnamed protein product [Clonostachys solani]
MVGSNFVELSAPRLNRNTTFRRTEQDDGIESSDSEWIAVDVRNREDRDSEDDEQSIVEISRGERISDITRANRGLMW